jgi:hypothetical protein
MSTLAGTSDAQWESRSGVSESISKAHDPIPVMPDEMEELVMLMI